MDISTNVSRFSVFMNHHPTDTADGPSDLPAYSVDATSDSDSEPGSQSTNPIPGQTLGIPAYSSNILRRERSEHTFVLNNRRNEPWATLKLKSSARSPDNMPTFVDDEPIEGSLLFSLDKKESITSVSVTVRGTITTGSDTGDRLAFSNSYVFLNDTQMLWTKTNKNLRIPTPFPLSTEIRHGGVLTGHHSWPFSVIIPQSVTIPPTSSEPSQTYRLPQTLVEKFTGVTIQYELLIKITRSALRPNSKIRTFFAYIPCTRSQPASACRQRAYRDNSQLLPPKKDPDGWKTLPPTVFRGMIFRTRIVAIQCTLSLASPLSYARGTVIPLFLTLSSKDTQALQLLSSNKTINVWLCRRVRYHMFPSHARKGNQTGAEWKEEDTEFLESAVWWPASDSIGDTNNRMNGEIRLSKDLMPSTSIAHLTVKYFVVVLPFEATAFTPSQAKDEPLVSQVVDVTTRLGPGPEPKAYAPPGYDYGKREPRASTVGSEYGFLFTTFS